MTQPPQHVDRYLIDNTLFLPRRPVGLIATCFALAARAWVKPPFLALIFRRAAAIPAHRRLRPPVRSLIDAVVMDPTLTNLTLSTQSRIAGAPKFALQVLVGALILTYSASRAMNSTPFH